MKRHEKGLAKRILCLFLVLVMVFGLFPPTALAVGEEAPSLPLVGNLEGWEEEDFLPIEAFDQGDDDPWSELEYDDGWYDEYDDEEFEAEYIFTYEEQEIEDYINPSDFAPREPLGDIALFNLSIIRIGSAHAVTEGAADMTIIQFLSGEGPDDGHYILVENVTALGNPTHGRPGIFTGTFDGDGFDLVGLTLRNIQQGIPHPDPAVDRFDRGMMRILGDGAVIRNLRLLGPQYNDDNHTNNWRDNTANAGFVAGRVLGNVTMENIFIGHNGVTRPQIIRNRDDGRTAHPSGDHKRYGGVVGFVQASGSLTITDITIEGLFINFQAGGSHAHWRLGLRAARSMAGGVIGVSQGNVSILTSEERERNEIDVEIHVRNPGNNSIGRAATNSQDRAGGAVAAGGVIGEVLAGSNSNVNIQDIFVGDEGGTRQLQARHATGGVIGRTTPGVGNILIRNVEVNMSQIRGMRSSPGDLNLQGEAGIGHRATGGIIGRTSMDTTIENAWNRTNIRRNDDTRSNQSYGTVGGIVGRSDRNLVIINARNDGQISSQQQANLGGIVGHATNHTTIRDSVNYGRIGNVGENGNFQRNNIGGIVGRIQFAGAVATRRAYLERVTNHGQVGAETCENGRAGGIVGFIQSAGSSRMFINDATNYGPVTGTRHTGGIVGRTDAANTHIRRAMNHGQIYATRENSTATANVNLAAVAGGLIGSAHGPDLRIWDSANTATVQSRGRGSGAAAGGLVGLMRRDRQEIRTSFNSGHIINLRTAGAYNTGGIVGGNRAGTLLLEDVFNIGTVATPHTNAGSGLIGRTWGRATIRRAYVGGTYTGPGVGLTGGPGTNPTLNRNLTLTQVYVDSTTTRRGQGGNLTQGHRNGISAVPTTLLVSGMLPGLSGGVWTTGFSDSPTMAGGSNFPQYSTYPFFAWQAEHQPLPRFFENMSPPADSPSLGRPANFTASGVQEGTRWFNTHFNAPNSAVGNNATTTVGSYNVNVTGDFSGAIATGGGDLRSLGLLNRNGIVAFGGKQVLAVFVHDPLFEGHVEGWHVPHANVRVENAADSNIYAGTGAAGHIAGSDLDRFGATPATYGNRSINGAFFLMPMAGQLFLPGATITAQAMGYYPSAQYVLTQTDIDRGYIYITLDRSLIPVPLEMQVRDTSDLNDGRGAVITNASGMAGVTPSSMIYRGEAARNFYENAVQAPPGAQVPRSNDASNSNRMFRVVADQIGWGEPLFATARNYIPEFRELHPNHINNIDAATLHMDYNLLRIMFRASLSVQVRYDRGYTLDSDDNEVRRDPGRVNLTGVPAADIQVRNPGGVLNPTTWDNRDNAAGTFRVNQPTELTEVRVNVPGFMPRPSDWLVIGDHIESNEDGDENLPSAVTIYLVREGMRRWEVRDSDGNLIPTATLEFQRPIYGEEDAFDWVLVPGNGDGTWDYTSMHYGHQWRVRAPGFEAMPDMPFYNVSFDGDFIIYTRYAQYAAMGPYRPERGLVGITLTQVDGMRHDVYFDLNDGNVDGETQLEAEEVLYGYSLMHNPPTPVREGFWFRGWLVNQNVDDGSEAPPNFIQRPNLDLIDEALEDLTGVIISGDTTFYALWERAYYRVTFDPWDDGWFTPAGIAGFAQEIYVFHGGFVSNLADRVPGTNMQQPVGGIGSGSPTVANPNVQRTASFFFYGWAQTPDHIISQTGQAADSYRNMIIGHAAAASQPWATWTSAGNAITEETTFYAVWQRRNWQASAFFNLNGGSYNGSTATVALHWGVPVAGQNAFSGIPVAQRQQIPGWDEYNGGGVFEKEGYRFVHWGITDSSIRMPAVADGAAQNGQSRYTSPNAAIPLEKWTAPHLHGVELNRYQVRFASGFPWVRTFDAHWERIAYNVVFDNACPDGSDPWRETEGHVLWNYTLSDMMRSTLEDELLLGDIFYRIGERESYIFMGWALSTDPGWQSEASHPNRIFTYEELLDFVVTDYIEFWAVWEPMVEVRFHLEGGSYRDDMESPILQRIPMNTSQHELPSREYLVRTRTQMGAVITYEFTGWALQPEGVTQNVANMFITEDTDFYAVWRRVPLPVSIVFIGNGGNPISTPAQTQTGFTVDSILANNIFHATGGLNREPVHPDDYEFLGWVLNPNDPENTLFDTGRYLEDADAPFIVLFAWWLPPSDDIIVRFDARAGNWGYEIQQVGDYEITIVPCDCVDPYPGEECEDLEIRTWVGQYEDDGVTPITERVYVSYIDRPGVYGQTYEFPLMGPGGTDPILSPQRSSSDPENGQEYIFLGWFTHPTAGEGLPVAINSLIQERRNHTVYAQWLSHVPGEEPPNIHRVFFHGNAGYMGLQSVLVAEEETFGRALTEIEEPSREGYTFIGWFDASERAVYPQRRIWEEGDTPGVFVAYAAWLELPAAPPTHIPVVFVGQGGRPQWQLQTSPRNSLLMAPEIIEDPEFVLRPDRGFDYDFEGWFTTPSMLDFEDPSEIDPEFLESGVAVWTPNEGIHPIGTQPVIDWLTRVNEGEEPEFITVYARWRPAREWVQVLFLGHGGYFVQEDNVRGVIHETWGVVDYAYNDPGANYRWNYPPVEPERQGFIFTGWSYFAGPRAGTEWDPDYEVLRPDGVVSVNSVIIVANWEPIDLSVRFIFDPMGGTFEDGIDGHWSSTHGPMDGIRLGYGLTGGLYAEALVSRLGDTVTEIGEPEPPVAPYGYYYVFSGWRIKETLEPVTPFATIPYIEEDYRNSDYFEYRTIWNDIMEEWDYDWIYHEDVRYIEAVWTRVAVPPPGEISIIFNGNGATTNASQSATVRIDQTFGDVLSATYPALPMVQEPTRDGYQFAGWMETAYGGVQFLNAHNVLYGLNLAYDEEPPQFRVVFASWIQLPEPSDYRFPVQFLGERGTPVQQMAEAQRFIVNEEGYPIDIDGEVILPEDSEREARLQPATVRTMFDTVADPVRAEYIFAGWWTHPTEGGFCICRLGIEEIELDENWRLTNELIELYRADGNTRPFMTLFARWVPEYERAQVTFDGNRGVPGGQTFTARIGRELGDNTVLGAADNWTWSEITEPSRSGYIFAGWYTTRADADSAYPLDEEDERRIGPDTELTPEMVAAGNARFYAGWVAIDNRVTVRFNANPGVFHFEDDRPFATTTLGYAQRGEGNFFAEAFVGLPTPVRVASAMEQHVAEWVFVGWFTESSEPGNTLPATAVPVGAATLVDAHFTGTMEEITLFAYWQPVPHTQEGLLNILFLGDGGTPLFTSGNAVIYQPGHTLAAAFAQAGVGDYGQANQPVRPNHDFMGWYTERDGRGTRVNATDLALDIFAEHAEHGRVTLFANWWALRMPIPATFLANGGRFYPDTPGLSRTLLVYNERTFGQHEDRWASVDAPENRPVQAGYNFMGWYTYDIVPGQAVRVTAETVVPEDAISLTVVARWEPIDDSIRIDFNPAGGSFVLLEEEVYYEGEYFVVEQEVDITTDPIFGRANRGGFYAEAMYVVRDVNLGTFEEGALRLRAPELTPEQILYGQSYIFLGWRDANSDTGSPVGAESRVPADAENMTLYAHWFLLPRRDPALVTVMFHGNGGMPQTQLALDVQLYQDAPANTVRSTYGYAMGYIVNDPAIWVDDAWNEYDQAFTGAYVDGFVVPVRPGYQFLGWFSSPDSTGYVGIEEDITEITIIDIEMTHVLYARWAQIPTATELHFPIVFHGEGGYPAIQAFLAPRRVLTCADVSPGNCIHNCEADGYEPGERIVYDGTLSMAFDHEHFVDMESDTARPGWEFVGWFTQPGGQGTEVERDTPMIYLDSSIEFYADTAEGLFFVQVFAHWRPARALREVRFLTSNVIPVVPYMFQQFNVEVAEPLFEEVYGQLRTPPNREGVQFAGWYFDHEFTQPVPANWVVPPGTELIEIFGRMEVISNEVTVTFNPLEGTFGIVCECEPCDLYDCDPCECEQTVLTGIATRGGVFDDAMAGIPVPTKAATGVVDSWDFIGWFTHPTEGYQVQNLDRVPTDALNNITLYARFTANVRTLTLHPYAHNSTEEPIVVQVAIGDTLADVIAQLVADADVEDACEYGLHPFERYTGPHFWGWFTADELTERAISDSVHTLDRRRPAVVDGVRVEATIYPATFVFTAEMFDNAEQNLDIFAIWTLWGDVTGSDHVGHTDWIRLREFLAFRPVQVDEVAAGVTRGPELGHADLMLLQRYLQHIPTVLGVRPQ